MKNSIERQRVNEGVKLVLSKSMPKLKMEIKKEIKKYCKKESQEGNRKGSSYSERY